MGMGFRNGGYMDGFGGNGPGAWGIVMFVAFWVAVALVLLALIRHYRHSPHHLHEYGAGIGHGPVVAVAPVAPVAPVVAANPAINILMERFAKGEVSEEEYTRRLTMLKGS